MNYSRLLGLAVLAISLSFLSGCAVVATPVGGAFNFTKWDGPISNPGVSSNKVGEACAASILGIIAAGDASIEAAKQNGGITKVATVDHRTTSILTLFGKYCTVVYGE